MLKGAFKYHFTQILPFVDPPPRSLTLLSLLVQPLPPNYHSLSLLLHFVSTHFYEFYYIFSIFITYISIIGSDITDPAIPLPPHITQLSLSEPTPRPLSVSDMIFERSLTVLCYLSGCFCSLILVIDATSFMRKHGPRPY